MSLPSQSTCMESKWRTLTTCHFIQEACCQANWVHMLIVASLMDVDLQVACDDHGFLWTRTVTNEFERPHPAFPPVLPLNRYPVITFKEHAGPFSDVGLAVDFDTWLTFRAGAMTLHNLSLVVLQVYCLLYESTVGELLHVAMGSSKSQFKRTWATLNGLSTQPLLHQRKC